VAAVFYLGAAWVLRVSAARDMGALVLGKARQDASSSRPGA